MSVGESPIMHIKYDREKALANGVRQIYERWAKDYKIDLSQPFLVYATEKEDDGAQAYRCAPPPSLVGRSEGVYLAECAFSPCAFDKNLEDYL